MKFPLNTAKLVITGKLALFALTLLYLNIDAHADQDTIHKAAVNETITAPGETPKPESFDIHYKVSFNGLPTGIDAVATLRKLQEHFQVELKAKSWMLSYHEKSNFLWKEKQSCNLQSEQYRFDFEGFKHESFFEIDIDPEKRLATSTSPGNEKQYEIPENVSDALAYLFKLQCDLRAGNLNPRYVIAYQNGIEHYIFEYQGKETLKTELGKIETLVLKRVYSSDKYQTTYWIAPSLDYLMVKMKHKEGRIVTATLNVKEINYHPE